MEPKLIMLVGMPGSGKSTWVREYLQKNPEYVVVSSDDIIEALGDLEGLNYQQAFEKFGKDAMREMKNHARKAFDEGKNVIWDQTNMTKKSRRGKLDMAKGYDKIAVVFEIPDAELERRLAQRENEIGKIIPTHVLKNMASNFQPPTKDEGFNRIVYVR